MELAFASALEQAQFVREGRVSSTELVELCLERIARIDLELNAFVTVSGEEARTAARAIDSGSGATDAPFRGVPIASRI